MRKSDLVIIVGNAGIVYTVPMNRTASPELIAQLVSALEAADLYLNSYDTSAPSRIKATTRADVEAAIGAYKAAAQPALDAAAAAIKVEALAQLSETSCNIVDGHAEREAYREHRTYHASKPRADCELCRKELLESSRFYARNGECAASGLAAESYERTGGAGAWARTTCRCGRRVSVSRPTQRLPWPIIAHHEPLKGAHS